MRKFIWDERKAKDNLATHRVAFSEIERFEFGTAIVATDERFEYGETREVAIGFIGVVLHVAVYTVRGDVLRLISLRKANRGENFHYAENA
ncbi:BrnT family toxin [Mesorhizobium sp. ASY16-5R]|jgi:uncharacterized DUF497 family protein|uniref:BrnT family toxin n=1 Tax=Mesorhizobium sp. ASY16-5R TaxID=3445772 RepID=UPI003F9F2982